MKINSKHFEHYLEENLEKTNIIFLYGTNTGLVELFYKKTLTTLGVDTNDPFNVSKIDGIELKDNPSILHDNICTLSMFSQKRLIVLDLINISITKNVEKIILEAIEKINEDNFLLIKCGNLKQNTFLKYFFAEIQEIRFLTLRKEKNTKK